MENIVTKLLIYQEYMNRTDSAALKEYYQSKIDSLLRLLKEGDSE